MVEKKWCDEFSQWAASFSLEDVPQPVRTKAKIQVANTIAAAFGGWSADGRVMLAPMKERGGKGEATALGLGEVDLFTAYYINASLSMWHDYDDYVFMGHTGHSAVFAALAAAEVAGASGTDFLRGVIAATELGGRLGASVLVGPHNGQMWAHIHAAEAAAAACTVWGVPSQQTAEALKLALYAPPFVLEPGFMGGDGKKTTAAASGEAGLRAALFATGGASVKTDVFSGPKGFFQRFSFLPLTAFLSAFGETWVLETLSVKPYPGCAYIQAPVECLEAVVEEVSGSGKEFSASEIKRIRVNASLLTVGMEKMSEPYRNPGALAPVNVNFSVPLSLGLYILWDGLKTRQLTHANLVADAEKLFEIADRVTLDHDWRFTFELARGLRGGINLFPLLRSKGLFRLARAFRRFRKEQSRISTPRELWRLLSSGHLSRLREFGGSFSRKKHFQFSQTHLKALAFNFGARVEVELKSGSRWGAERVRHKGAAGCSIDELMDVLETKFLREAEHFTGSAGKAGELYTLLMDIEQTDIKAIKPYLLPPVS